MKNYYVMTLFPELITNVVHESITGRAIKSGLMNVEAFNIRDYTRDPHNHVDDYPYGGGAGMLMQVQPIVDSAYRRYDRSSSGTSAVYVPTGAYL